MKIVIGSENLAKVVAVESVFQNDQVEFMSVKVPSEVSDQPYSDEETIKGAINRAYNALEAGDGDIGIGLEGGVQETEYGLFLCNWGALAEGGKPPIIAGGARLPLPTEMAEQLRAGNELGPVMERVTNRDDVRKREGAVGIFTNGYINRAEMFMHVVKLLAGQYTYRKSNEDSK